MQGRAGAPDGQAVALYLKAGESVMVRRQADRMLRQKSFRAGRFPTGNDNSAAGSSAAQEG